MIETGCYDELNVFGANYTLTPDLMLDAVPEKETEEGCFPFKKKVSIYVTNECDMFVVLVHIFGIFDEFFSTKNKLKYWCRLFRNSQKQSLSSTNVKLSIELKIFNNYYKIGN